MRSGKVPEHLKSLVQNLTEIATDESFDIAKTWFEGFEEPSKSSPMDVPIILQSSDPSPSASKEAAPLNEGAAPANEGAPPANEGADSEDPFALSAAHLINQRVSDPLQGSEGDAFEMPKIVNLADSGLRRSPLFLPKKSKLVAFVTGACKNYRVHLGV